MNDFICKCSICNSLYKVFIQIPVDNKIIGHISEYMMCEKCLNNIKSTSDEINLKYGE